MSKVLEEEPPSEIGDVLEEFKDVIPPKLPKALPPRWIVDHAIELVPGAKPPTQTPYRMSLRKLAELRRQLNELLHTGFIKPSKAPYDAPVLFQKKQDRSLQIALPTGS